MNKRFATILALASTLGMAAFAADREAKVQDRLDASADTLTDMMKASDKGIPQDLLDKARCIVVIPGMKKAGFILGAKYGSGFASCRREGGGWTAPAAMRSEAWADLQQLPAPWTPPAGQRGQSQGISEQHVVEFGNLDEGDDEPDAIPFQVRRPATTIDAAESRLEQSEALLGQLDDDFRPAGSIGPLLLPQALSLTVTDALSRYGTENDSPTPMWPAS